MRYEEELIRILNTKEHLMRDLLWVQQLELPNWCIAAGYVRNCVWDHLHGYTEHTPLNDVDILYYDSSDIREETEKINEIKLRNLYDGYNWSIKNQARMHIKNDDLPFSSVAEAMTRWPEVVTAVGVRLDDHQEIEIIAPHGLDDLFNLVIRQSPYFKDKEYYLTRVRNKNWLAAWPKLRMA
ncbi:nucleotidyltransferase family protein [Paenibacillus dakarensis]|uniref:nucleotidyltransferase family protein n=1 Tax=Paenibacillus dakarensis TaxID=1527293 RepID=UPI000A976AF1|nr:nucleotidyltransferase family protein [Paenibacillus dakarensis]